MTTIDLHLLPGYNTVPETQSLLRTIEGTQQLTKHLVNEFSTALRNYDQKTNPPMRTNGCQTSLPMSDAKTQSERSVGDVLPPPRVAIFHLSDQKKYAKQTIFRTVAYVWLNVPGTKEHVVFYAGSIHNPNPKRTETDQQVMSKITNFLLQNPQESLKGFVRFLKMETNLLLSPTAYDRRKETLTAVNRLRIRLVMLVVNRLRIRPVMFFTTATTYREIRSEIRGHMTRRGVYNKNIIFPRPSTQADDLQRPHLVRQTCSTVNLIPTDPTSD